MNHQTTAVCEHDACHSVRLTRDNIRLVETTGCGPHGNPDYPVTDVYTGDRFLGAIRDDGYRTRDGRWVTRMVVFAGGQCVCLPEYVRDPDLGEWARTEDSRAATLAAFVVWCSLIGVEARRSPDVCLYSRLGL
jgi:hypothetical protein